MLSSYEKELLNSYRSMTDKDYASMTDEEMQEFEMLEAKDKSTTKEERFIESANQMQQLPIDRQKLREYEGKLASEQMGRDIEGAKGKAAWQSAVEKTKLPILNLSPVEVAYPISVNQAYKPGYEAPSVSQGMMDAGILATSVLPPIRGGGAAANIAKNVGAQGLLSTGQELIQSKAMDRELSPMNIALGTGLGSLGAAGENTAIRRLGESFGNQPAAIKAIESMDFSKLTKDNASGVIQNELNKQLGSVPVRNTEEFKDAVKRKIANVIESNWSIKKPGYTKRADVDEMLNKIDNEVESIMKDTPRLTTKQLENLSESEDLYEQLLAKKSREAAADVTSRQIGSISDVRNLQKALKQSAPVTPFKLPMIGTNVSPEVLRYGRVLTAARPIVQNLPQLQ